MRKKNATVRIADVYFVYGLAIQKAYERHMIERLLKEAGRNRARRTAREYLEAENDFDAAATLKRSAALAPLAMA